MVEINQAQNAVEVDPLVRVYYFYFLSSNVMTRQPILTDTSTP